MKKTITFIAVAIISILFVSSCTKEDPKSISFSPSSVSVSVGNTKTVDFDIKGMDAGVYDVQYYYPSDIVSVTATFGKMKIKGIAKGTGTIEAYLVDYPNVKGSLSVTVK